MNEKALQRLFELAKQDGYVNTFEDFTLLLSNNEEAASTMFNLAMNDGYEKSFEEFSTLVGFVKKKKKTKSLRLYHWKLALLSPPHYQETSVLT